MQFSLHMCGDVDGMKVNLIVQFIPKPESVARIAEEFERILRGEYQRAGRDPRMGIAIDFIVYYDDGMRRWKPLESVNQLAENMQLYCFQVPRAGAPRETVGEIPAPREVVQANGIGQRQIHHPQAGQVSHDKIVAVFNALDINNTQTIEPSEFIHGFLEAGIDFNEETITRIFEKCDANSDQHLDVNEFTIFAESFPNTVETLYWRLLGPETMSREPNDNASQLKAIRQNEYRLKRELQELDRQKKRYEQMLRTDRNIRREMDPRRRMIEDEEQDLINKEFALQFHRDMVVQAETQFCEAVVRFDHATMRQGSPRRARTLPV